MSHRNLFAKLNCAVKSCKLHVGLNKSSNTEEATVAFIVDMVALQSNGLNFNFVKWNL